MTIIDPAVLKILKPFEIDAYNALVHVENDSVFKDVDAEIKSALREIGDRYSVRLCMVLEVCDTQTGKCGELYARRMAGDP